MAEALPTLIRLTKLTLDEKRKIVTTIETEIARVEQHKAELLQRLEQEKASIAQAPEGSFTIGPFIKATFKKRDQLDHQLAELAKILDAAQDEVRKAFEELKRYEIAKQLEDEREAKEAARRETKQMDEVGATRTQREKSRN